MMSRVYVYLLLLDRAGQVGDQWNTQKGRAGRVLWLFRGFYVVSLIVSIKDHAVLALMASLELCTDCMSGFMRPDKPSSFCNYYVEPHLPASCGAFTLEEE
jgi:hypothetical protein